MNDVDSFVMDSDVIASYNIQQTSETSREVTRWQGERSVDIPNQKMYMTMNIDKGYYPNLFSGNYCGLKVNRYYYIGYSYEQWWTCYRGNTQGMWQKLKLPELIWNAQTQLSPLLGLLRTASQVILLRSETINSHEYLVMAITPSAEAVTDWVLSQDPNGPGISFEPSLYSGKNMHIKGFKSGVFQLWIDSDTYFITQMKFTSHFEATSDELSELAGEQILMQDIEDFLGQISFSNYNQPVSIQLPQEALEAK